MLLGSLLPTESLEQMALFEWAEMYKKEYPELQLIRLRTTEGNI